MTSEQKGTDAQLLAALDNPSVGFRGRRCQTGQIISALSPELADRIESIITELRTAREQGTETRYTAVWLARTLTDNGYPITSVSIGNHVLRRCRCER